MKTLKSLFIALTITLTMTASKPSQAAIGAIFSPVLVTAGIVVAAGGGGLMGVALLTPCTGSGCMANLGPWILGGIIGLFGLVILDDEQTAAYTPLNIREAKKIGISPVELQNFNNEVDQINALAAYVDTELSRMNKPTKEDSAALWSEVKDTLSPEAFSALVKVTSQIYAK
jgi:hypothetical protein